VAHRWGAGEDAGGDGGGDGSRALGCLQQTVGDWAPDARSTRSIHQARVRLGLDFGTACSKNTTGLSGPAEHRLAFAPHLYRP
jgi:hypothetical protein